jgi:hypothetical protein
MTPRTPQCEVFWALLSNLKHSGIPEDSKSPTLGVLGFTPTLGQGGVATSKILSHFIKGKISLSPMETILMILGELEHLESLVKLARRRRDSKANEN